MFRLTKQELFTIGVLVLLVAAVIVGVTIARRPHAEGVPVDLDVNTGARGAVQGSKEGGTGGPTITVHVAGEVVSPGVYRLPFGSRVNDAVREARPTSQADPDALNLAARLSDGDKILVPAVGSASGVVSPDAGASDGLVDLNTATQAELETLPGIGPVRAESIIDYRSEHRFGRVEDVMKVPGIGPGTFERIKDRIVVR